ncbi:MAG TPA: GFA family protein [Polyangiaceae bacterium]|nr:GFA family protein [Polyangiaceae bacterium]
MERLKTYTGSCHCGKVRFEVELDLGGQFIACNCSMCGRTGTLLTFVPSDKFKLLSGGDDLTDYQFNKKQIHHLFCATCGVKSFAKGIARDGSEMRAVNARCLEGVDADTLNIKHFDGKNR